MSLARSRRATNHRASAATGLLISRNRAAAKPMSSTQSRFATNHRASAATTLL
jgi:hypothetical protein